MNKIQYTQYKYNFYWHKNQACSIFPSLFRCVLFKPEALCSCALFPVGIFLFLGGRFPFKNPAACVHGFSLVNLNPSAYDAAMGDIPYDVEVASIVFVCCFVWCVALCFDCDVPIFGNRDANNILLLRWSYFWERRGVYCLGRHTLHWEDVDGSDAQIKCTERGV